MHASTCSCHVIFLYNLFGLLAYSAEHRNSSFFLFSVAEYSVHPYFCYLNVCNTEIMMCGWKDCLCCSFWTSISMNEDLNVFDTCFISSASVELELRVFCRHPYQWMTAFTHRQLQNVLLTLHWHSPCETVAIDSWIVAIQEKYRVGVWIKIAIFFYLVPRFGGHGSIRFRYNRKKNTMLSFFSFILNRQ